MTGGQQQARRSDNAPRVSAAGYAAPVAVVLALLSSLLWGSADFLGGLTSRRRPALAVVGGSQACGLITISALAVATRAWDGPISWAGWALASGACGTVGLVCFYAALGSAAMGVVSPIAALGATVPVAVGVVAGERPSSLTTAGLAVALAGAVAASGPEVRGGGPGRSRSGARPVVLAAVAGVSFGLTLVFVERGARVDPVMTLLGMRVTSVTVFAVVAVVAGGLGGLGRRDVPALVAVGVGDVLANLMFALASQRGFLSITALLGSLYPVATVLLARFVLHERLSRVQQLGVLTAMVGVALIALGRAPT